MIVSLITKLLGGTLLDKLIGAYVQIRKADAEGDAIAAETLVKSLEVEVESQRIAREIRLSTSGFWEMRLITFLIAAPLALHQLIVVYDTLDTSIALAIPKLPPPFDEYQGAILMSFFGLQVGNKLLDTAAYVLRKR